MLTFNTLLREGGVDPANVQLVRHKDRRARGPNSPYALWAHNLTSFEFYQCLQVREKFDVPSLLASFVVPPSGETLLAGIYQVSGIGRNGETVTCPATRESFSPDKIFVYGIERTEILAEYSGLVAIDWGAGALSWVQRASKQNKRVLEIRRQREDPPFPGFTRFETKTTRLDTIPIAWIEALRSTGGVYLLVSEHNGEQYVGSATGDEGFWSRWQAYANDGHGGNQVLRVRGRPPYAISILETASSLASRSDVIGAEQRWKRKLGSRAFGLNGN